MNGKALECAHETLRKDKEFVLEAVKYNEWALENLHETLRDDKEFILEAVK